MTLAIHVTLLLTLAGALHNALRRESERHRLNAIWRQLADEMAPQLEELKRRVLLFGVSAQEAADNMAAFTAAFANFHTAEAEDGYWPDAHVMTFD